MITREVPSDVEVMSVGELTRDIKRRLEAGYPCVWVSGEISNLSRPSSGHVYLSLRDSASTIPCAFYRGLNLRLRFDLRDGMEVICKGRLTVYEPRGQYQFIVEEVVPKGIGAAELALQQLKEKLLKRGFFDPKRKRAIPRFPRRIGLVTSATGAAVRDMLEILGKRWPVAEVVIRGVRVQGEPAPAEIAAAITMFNRLHESGSLRLDTIIIGRGGGSSEDLDAFNSELVAEALFASRVPTIAAIGHEIDITIADLVADHRAATPSQAAELATPDRFEMIALLDQAKLRLSEGVRARLKLATLRVTELANRRALRLPLERVRELEQRLDERSARLFRSIRIKLEREQNRVEAVAGKLATLSPLNVLARGYSLTRSEMDATGESLLLRSSDEVQPGQLIRTTLHSGEVISRVEMIEPPTTAATFAPVSGMTVDSGKPHQ